MRLTPNIHVPARRQLLRAIPLGAVVAVLASVLPTATPASAQPWRDDPVEILALSNRADLISGGDVLVEVVLPDRADPAEVVVATGDRDVTDAFALRDDGRYLGRVEGLPVGTTRLTATLPDGTGAALDVTSHPAGGPVFAGPQVQPWTCATDAAGLGPAQDEQCTGETVHEYRYKSSATGQFAAYDPDSPPGDVATTTTDEGHEVPYVIRVERGTIDRGIYEVAVLFDPEQPWEPWAPQEQWNGKLYWIFGGDCKPWHDQTSASAVNDMALSRGFAVATGGLNTLGTNCNDAVVAEHVMMLKERIVETYGEVRYTMSEGCSGGSMQQHWIAANYPGLLDGIQPSCSYPDIWETMQAAEDCHVMDRVFLEVSPHLWANPDDQAEAAGHLAATTCRSLWDNPSGEAQYARTWFDPDYAAGCGLDAAVVYDAETNPGGVRCTLQDYQVALWGRRPAEAWTAPEQAIGRGFANRPFDNVGVQYGLAALEAGDILPAQFVDLNVNAGGIDIDWDWQPERSVADPAALERAYLGGRVTHGGELDRVPIMDIRGSSNLEIHTDVHTWVIRARLDAANGHHDNQVSWNSPCPLLPCPPIPEQSFVTLDAWLAAIEADDRDVPLEQKVVDNKPAQAVDGCWIGGQFIDDQAQCDTVLPYFATPRLTAGAPMTDDVLKCQLKPLDRADYTVTFSDAEWAQLEAAFPDGVCDYSLPGVGQQPPRGPWQTYAEGPDGIPLGDPPASVPFGPDGPPPLVTRHDGPTRIETAVAVSGLGVEQADTVVLARADDHPDALAGGPLAVHLGAPLLLTAPDGLSEAVAAELTRLGATQAVLLGGEQALTPQVATDLEALGMTVRRIAGPSRWATAAAIAAELPATGQVLLARGDAFPDALAASGLGAATATPVLLTRPDQLPDETAAALSAQDDITIIGGTAAVSEAVAETADGLAATVTRIAGATRYATSAAVADAALAAGITPAITWLATGANFPDALVAGAAAGRDAGILLLIDGTDLDGSPQTRDWLTAHTADIDQIRLAGGTAAISTAVHDALAAPR
jgi:putative cell wall-binding protein